ncbi:hypothetical protein Xph01_38620 [Micromonospora phaseoli]|nr:hypothetical protein Xph01_38620 [Micromonospora phaseoli]
MAQSQARAPTVTSRTAMACSGGAASSAPVRKRSWKTTCTIGRLSENERPTMREKDPIGTGCVIDGLDISDPQMVARIR